MNRIINQLIISVALTVSVGMMSCGVLQAAEPAKKPAQAQAASQTAKKDKPAKKKDPNAPATYKVQHVASDDSLNVRVLPGPDADVLTRIPHNGRSVLSTGRSRKLGRAVWAEVRWAGKTGWVNKYYLTEEVKTAALDKLEPKKTEVYMKCNGSEPFWMMKITEKLMDVNVVDAEKYQVKVDFRKQSANNTSIAIVAGRRGNALTTVFLQKVEACSDGMSKTQYPYSIAAMLNSKRSVSGCCSIVGAK